MFAILEDSKERMKRFWGKFPDAFIANDPDEFIKFVLDNINEIELKLSLTILL